MGLTVQSVGRGAAEEKEIRKLHCTDQIVALAGNPNVGKSTLFNGLTGMKQHTGNWPGKTVSVAQGSCRTEENEYILVDIPGTYSLLAHSAEEEVARNFLCFGEPDAVAVVCDATCLERNLNLVLQTLEISPRVLVCVNLMDEAKRKKIRVSTSALSRELGVPVVGISARKKSDLREVLRELDALPDETSALRVTYPEPIERAILLLESAIAGTDLKRLDRRFVALKLLEHDDALNREMAQYLGTDLTQDPTVQKTLKTAGKILSCNGFAKDAYRDAIVTTLTTHAEEIARKCVKKEEGSYHTCDRKLDRILTGRITGYPIMLLFLLLTFFLTISVSNIPSGWLSALFGWLEERLTAICHSVGVPEWLHGALVLGVFRTLGWVVSVMLPPMAIFFPLFTLLEDAGYLPRVAYNLDRPFCACHACGKQALSMCMGFGCNAAGVVGCRIIDSPRERLLAVLTNAFVPCNGRFPALIAILTMFFVGSAGGLRSSALSALLLTAVIVFSILMTFLATRLLSVTLLRGVPSAFTLELPPFRRPQPGKILVRSLLDRTLFVLGRAATVAAPAGLLLWLLANLSVGGMSLFAHCAAFLDPFARLMGLDGVILIAFILGFPANEIVIPIILMGYLSTGVLTETTGLSQMFGIFTANGWTWATAVSVILFFLLHWPCSTTLLTIKKETGSVGWTLLAALLPTAFGIISCMLFTAVVNLFR